MRKLVYIASALLLSAAITGCAGNEDKNAAEGTTSFSLTAGFEIGNETKTANPTAPVWTNGDMIGITIVDNSTGTVAFENIGVPGITDNGGQTATFAGTLPDFNAGEYAFHAYYPYGDENNYSDTATEAKIIIPAVQRPTATSFDPMADVMLMKSFDYIHDGSAMSHDGLRFKRALGMIKFVLDMPEVEGQHIRKLTFKTDNPELQLAGKADFDLVAGEFSGFYSDAVTQVIAVPSGDILADGTGEIWVCIPAMTIGTDVTITVEGETEGYTFTKSATVGEVNDGQPIEIVAGNYHTMNVTLGADEVTERQPDVIIKYARGQLANPTPLYGVDKTPLDLKLFEYDEVGPVEERDGWNLNINTIAPMITGDVLNLPAGTYVIAENPRGAQALYTVDAAYYCTFMLLQDGVFVRQFGYYYEPKVNVGSYMVVTGDSTFSTISLSLSLSDGTSMYFYYEGPLTMWPKN